MAENQIGISSESGNHMASGHGRHMVPNFKARLAILRARYKALIVRVKEGVVGHLISWYEVEECFFMGVRSHGENLEERGWRYGTERNGTGYKRGRRRLHLIESEVVRDGIVTKPRKVGGSTQHKGASQSRAFTTNNLHNQCVIWGQCKCLGGLPIITALVSL